MWRYPAISVLLLASLLSQQALGAPDCPILGPAFPKPQKPSANAAVQAAVASLTSQFNAKATAGDVPSTNLSWSIEIFSANEPGLIWSHYHTQTNLAQVNNTGVSKVDTNTVFRLGSLTKIFSVLNWLVADGDVKWRMPITDYLPELRAIQARSAKNSVYYTNWDTLTIGALMSQMAGLPRDYTLLGELTQEYTNNQLVAVGFPALAEAQIPQCGEWPLCNRTEFFTALETLPPSYPADSTPGYSNIAYQLLGYALENIKGKSWFDQLNANVLKPLNLQRTYYSLPNNTKEVGIVAGNYTETGWANLLGEEGPAGSMYSSAGDITKLGRSILKSTLIPAAMTRRWLKPVDFTSDPAAGLSTPWGIRKIQVGDQPYRWTYAYQKAGSIGRYSSMLIVLPDYDIGFTILMAGNMPVNFNFDAADAIGTALLPAFEAAARAEAGALFAGSYATPVSSSDYNATMTIVADDGNPGLGVSSWISNGTDMNYVAVTIQESAAGSVVPSVRLYPTLLEAALPNGGRAVSFKAVFGDRNSTTRTGRMFSTDCASWLTATSIMYGGLPLDDFVFNIDAAGKVTSVSPIALRTTMDRTG